LQKLVAKQWSRSTVSRRVLTLLFAVMLTSTGVVSAQDIAADQSDHAPPASDSLGSPTPVRLGPNTVYPDPALTPGAVLESATPEVVCVRGYTRAVRDVKSTERVQVYAEYGISDISNGVELDHYIPLELGGSNDLANLWPEPYTFPGAHEKDRVENYLHSQVCGGAMTLADAQQAIASDWYAIYLTLANAHPTSSTPTQ
jgi:hypothetical protein